MPHPDLDALTAEARAVYAAGPTPRPLTPAERHTLLDEVVEARSLVNDPMHPYQVMGTAGRLVRARYAAHGWWEVKPRHWPRDLEARDPAVARQLHAVLSAPEADARQAALEALALGLMGGLEYAESATEPQAVP